MLFFREEFLCKFKLTGVRISQRPQFIVFASAAGIFCRVVAYASLLYAKHGQVFSWVHGMVTVLLGNEG